MPLLNVFFFFKFIFNIAHQNNLKNIYKKLIQNKKIKFFKIQK